MLSLFTALFSGRIVRNIAWCCVPKLVFQVSRLPFLLKCYTWHCFVFSIQERTFSAFIWSMERSYLLASLSIIPGLPPNPGKWNFCGSPLLNSFWTIVSYFNPISFLFQSSRIFSHTLFCWRKLISSSMVMKFYKPPASHFCGLIWEGRL